MATYERAGHKVRLWFLPEFERQSERYDLYIHVVIRNRGLAAVQVESIAITRTTVFRGAINIDLTNEKSAVLLEGEPIPQVLSGNSVLRLKFNLRKAVIGSKGQYRRAEASDLFRYVNRGTLRVGLGDGTTAIYERSLGHFMVGDRDLEEHRRLWSHNRPDLFEKLLDDDSSGNI